MHILVFRSEQFCSDTVLTGKIHWTQAVIQSIISCSCIQALGSHFSLRWLSLLLLKLKKCCQWQLILTVLSWLLSMINLKTGQKRAYCWVCVLSAFLYSAKVFFIRERKYHFIFSVDLQQRDLMGCYATFAVFLDLLKVQASTMLATVLLFYLSSFVDLISSFFSYLVFFFVTATVIFQEKDRSNKSKYVASSSAMRLGSGCVLIRQTRKHQS